jgi:hypothetical protein
VEAGNSTARYGRAETDMNHDTHEDASVLLDLVPVLVWRLNAIAVEVFHELTLKRLMCTNCGDVGSVSPNQRAISLSKDPRGSGYLRDVESNGRNKKTSSHATSSFRGVENPVKIQPRLYVRPASIH